MNCKNIPNMNRSKCVNFGGRASPLIAAKPSKSARGPNFNCSGGFGGYFKCVRGVLGGILALTQEI